MPAIKRVSLSRSAIEAAKPAESPYRLWDARKVGLCLRVLPGGGKTWELHWGRSKSIKLGIWPTVTLEGARTRVDVLLAEVAEHGAPLAVLDRKRAAGHITLADFLTDDYEPWQTANRKDGARTVARIRSAFAGMLDDRLDQLQGFAFERWRTARLKAGRAPSTINRDFNAIRAAMSMAVEWGRLQAHPLTKVKRSKVDNVGVVRYLDKDEEKAIREALTARDREATVRRDSGNAWRASRGREAMPAIIGYADHLTPLVLLAINTGCRRGELTQLTWGDIDLTRRLLTVRAGYAKSGTARHIPLNSEAVEVLRTCRGSATDPASRVFDVAEFKKSWTAVLAAAKITRFRFHDLRHTFASKLVMGGVDLNTVRELLGHSDIKMTLRYAHLAPEHKAAAVEMLVG